MAKRSGKREFRHESMQDRESIVAYLDALRSAIADGEVKFQDEQGEISLVPRGLIHFEVEASHKRDRRRLTLQFTWKEATESPVQAQLLITSTGQTGGQTGGQAGASAAAVRTETNED